MTELDQLFINKTKGVKNIFSQVYDELFNKPGFNALDTESISAIIIDGNIFWFEYSSYSDLDDSDFSALKRS